MPTDTAAEAFHEAACGVLEIQPGHGSKTKVASALGVSPSQYSDAWGHRGSLETLTKWAGRLGLWTQVAPDGDVSFEPAYYAIVTFGQPSEGDRQPSYDDLEEARRDLATLRGGSMTNARIVRCPSAEAAAQADISDGYPIVASR